MKLSAKQAAKEVGKSVPTITRAIKSGTISATKTDSGGYEIDPSELFRVFQPIKSNKGNITSNDTSSIAKQVTPNVTSVLELEIKFLNESLIERQKRIDDKDVVILDLQKRLDDEAIERRKLTLLLADQREKTQQQTNTDKALLWLLPLFSGLLVAIIMIGLFFTKGG